MNCTTAFHLTPLITPHNPIMASEEQIKADNIVTIDNLRISGFLNPMAPYEKLSNANIIIVIGNPKEMITPNPL
jgi:hypothetical protein